MFKRVLMMFGLVGVCLVSNTLYAAQDRYGNQFPAMWRSSRTASADNFVLVSSVPAAVVLHAVNTHLAVAGSSITIYNSTSTSIGVVGASTFTIVDTSVNRAFPFDVILSSGFVYEKRGTAEVMFEWEYLKNTGKIP